MKKFFVYAIAGLLLIGGGCGNPVTISTDYDKQADFTKYKTFGFLKWNEESAQLVNDIDQRRLQNAVAAELTKRGLTQSDGIGDCMIGFHVIIKQETGTTSYTNYYGGMGYYGYGGFGYGYGYPYGGGATTTTSTYEYNVGTVIIDQFDVETKKLVWEGIAQGVIESNPKNREEKINYNVGRLFANYPIPAKTE